LDTPSYISLSYNVHYHAYFTQPESVRYEKLDNYFC